ncbi:unnamed protein product [Anisakis simplex]|uniref:Arylacetamide deacetylase n=1 Tax=Anisakis simplex TaxID=6269 RepID=A0A158PNB4_ANISI|nr:unnamed protein product [Anisakis simplex]
MVLIYAYTIYRPLPIDFTDNPYDKTVFHVIELFLRLSVIYPTRIFCGDDVYCEVGWSRWVIDSSSWLISSLTIFDDAQLTIKTEYFNSIRARIYRPKTNNIQLSAVLYVHGGGFVMGNIEAFDSLAKRLAIDANTVVVSIDYRLAPEYAFPSALDDVENAVVYLLKHAYKVFGIDRSRVAIMGDSAGGGLVASLTQRLRERNDVHPLKAQVLLYPLLQMGNMRTPSYQHYHHVLRGRGFLEPRAVALYYLAYTGIDLRHESELIHSTLQNAHLSSLDRKIVDRFVDIDQLPHSFKTSYNFSSFSFNEEASHLLSPFIFNPDFMPLIQSNLSSLPQALVVTCQHDILRDEGVIYAKRLSQAGVPTTWKHLETGFHGLFNFHSTMITASRALSYVTEWLRNNV